MRRSSDLPRRRRVSGRAILITFGVMFLVVAVFGRGDRPHLHRVPVVLELGPR
ncbi:MAG: hypothetical protein WKF58_18435 [Ilumatobacteraceae bacterium]